MLEDINKFSDFQRIYERYLGSEVGKGIVHLSQTGDQDQELKDSSDIVHHEWIKK